MRISEATVYLSANDEFMARIIAGTGLISLPPPKGDFETLVDAIVSQQLSIKAAATIFGRLVHLLENDVTPKRILGTSPDALRSVGLSGQKTAYMYALADAFAKNRDQYSRLHEMEDSEVIKSLTAIKGIGVWTAQMFLIFTLLREDVWPAADLGIQRGMHLHIMPGQQITSLKSSERVNRITERAEVWRPFRSVASLYLWKSTDL